MLSTARLWQKHVSGLRFALLTTAIEVLLM
jgi:hypothetical protein